jgi:hypothetical protein
MKLKLDDSGHAVLQDGKPVYTHDDGKEVAFDAPRAFAKIGELTSEAAGSRKRAETAEAGLKPFTEAGLSDPAAAVSALATVKNLDQKSLVAAGDVEKIKTEAIKAVEDKYKPYVKKAEALEGQISSYMLGTAFKGSKFATEKLAAKGQAGADLAQALVGPRFKVEGDKIIGHHANGERIFSRTRPGELADFEEALEVTFDAHPHRDSYMAATGASGGGAPQGGNPATGGKKTMTRTQYEAAPPQERAGFMKAGVVVVD